MESFEHVCKVALEAEGFVVTSNVKFFVRRRVSKASREEYQTHGYEVDLVGARSDQLVLAEVKSFFGSRGVNSQSFRGLADESKRTDFGGYKLLNDADLRKEVRKLAADQYGYRLPEVTMRLFVGKFTRGHEALVCAHLKKIGVQVETLGDITDALIERAKQRTYTDDPVVMTVKALAAAGKLPVARGLPEGDV